MFFLDKLQFYRDAISVEMDALLNRAFNSQPHSAELLILYANGAYDSEMKRFLIGPDIIGISEQTHYDFINSYRYLNKLLPSFQDYDQLFKNGLTDELRQVEQEETFIIQLEMLIYLKFWEADFYIKWFAQLMRLVDGQFYDWSFQSGKRKQIWNKQVIDRLSPISESLNDIFTKGYIPQLRNSIAHSNYSIFGRHIQLNNDPIRKEQPADRTVLSIARWTDIFHITVSLHDEHVRINNIICDHYAKQLTDECDTITIVMHNPKGERFTARLEYLSRWQDWRFRM